MAERISYCKAAAVLKRHPDSIVIGVDTMVVLKRKIFGKPRDPKDAVKILKALRGKAHKVITAFTIIDSKRRVTRSVETRVFMRNFSDNEISKYVKTGEPLDKAGAYGIQRKGGLLIERIEGDYYSVVGLPITPLMIELRKFGIRIL